MKPTCAVHGEWRRWRRRWRRGGHTSYESDVVWTDSGAIPRHRGSRRDHHTSRGRGQDGDVSVSLLVDFDGALFLQLMDLLLQVGLPLDGLVLLLQHLPQGEHLRGGVLVDFLCGERDRRDQHEGSLSVRVHFKDKCRCSEQEPHLDGFQVLVSLHQLLLQLHDLGHGLILHVLQFLCHL